MSRLGQVCRGRLATPLRFLFYGAEGVGKSSLAADAPKPIFLDLEDGSALIDCARYPFRDGRGGHVAKSYGELTAAVDDLTKSEHDFETVIIDTIDQLEPMIWSYICERDNPHSKQNLTSIESYGYGKGYQIALDEWRAFCRTLDVLRARRGMNVVLLGHAQIVKFKNPEGEDFDRYTLRIQDKPAGFFREWCDVIGFCCFDGGVANPPGDEKGKRKERARGFSTGRRLMRFERTAAYDAKRRIPLPETVEITAASPWRPITAAMQLVQADAENLIKHIDAEIERIGDEDITQMATEFRRKHNDTKNLVRLLNRLRSMG